MDASSSSREALAVARLKSYAWPGELLAVLRALQARGDQAYLVGGHVRDILLDRAPDDTFDVATSVRPDAVRARFERVVPTGLRHGTVLILEGPLRLECTTFRREGRYGDARRPDAVTWTQDLREDLGRRDLTINALAYDPVSCEFVDAFGGLADLEHGVLRTVGDPEERFMEDALRPLRVARFASTLQMSPDARTLSALGVALDRSEGVAPERVQQELRWMLSGATPSRGLDLMQQSGMLRLWLPELDACVGVEQNRFHAHDVYRHSVLTCDAAPADREHVRWAALLHDIGKPVTRNVREDGEATFYRHQLLGAEMVTKRLEALRFPKSDNEAISHLVREHMFDYGAEWSDAGVRRWLRRVTPEAVDDLFALRRADIAGTGIRGGRGSDLSAMRERIDAILARDGVLSLSDLRVDGADVMRVLAIPPGPRVGQVLEVLLQHVIERPELNDREQLLQLIEVAASRVGGDGCDA